MTNLTYYQKEAVQFLGMREKGILCMGCRTGKSRTALTAANLNSSDKTIVVCPPSLINTWNKEGKASAKNLYLVKKTDKDWFLKHSKIGYNRTLIIDEMHESSDWQTSRDLLRFAMNSKFVYMLTATILINRAIDLYWPLKICGLWPWSKEDFVMNYCSGVRHPYLGFIKAGKPSNVFNLKKRLEKCAFFYERPDTKWIEKTTKSLGKMPFKTGDKIQQYSARQNLLATAKTADKKVINLMECYDMITSYRKVVMIYFHDIVPQILKKHFPHPIIHGKISMGRRWQTIAEFNKAAHGGLWLSYKAGGRGLDIPADYMVFVEKTWSPAQDYQTYMRGFGFERNKPLKVVNLLYDDEAKFMVSTRKQEELGAILAPPP